MTKDDRDIVSTLREALVDKVGKDRYDLWFGRGTRVRVRGANLVVEVSNRFSLEWLREQFADEIAGVARQVLGKAAEITFLVDESLAGGDGPSTTPSTKSVVPDSPSPPRRTAVVGVAGGTRPLEQLDSFVVGDGSRVAVKAAEMVVRTLGEISPLFVHGPHGSGKTHLLEGIWSDVCNKWPAKRCVYLSAEQFTSLFLDALHGSGLPNFRRKYRGVALLIIDDIQFFLGKKATLVEVLHTVDTVLRQGQQLVLASDRPPAELAGLGRELTNRLSSGLVCGIAPPDQRTRLGIARRWADESPVEVPGDVVRWVATHVAGDARLLRGAINRLRATSEALERPVTRQMAEEHLSDLVQVASCLVRLADIERAVCDVFELDPRSLRSDRKVRGIAHPRMLAMWLARKYTRAGLSEIGEHFGRRSHSTVISANRKVSGWLTAGGAVEGPHGSWKAEDALRKIERLLRSA